MTKTIMDVISELEALQSDPNGVEGDLFDSGFDCGIQTAIERLREVSGHDQ